MSHQSAARKRHGPIEEIPLNTRAVADDGFFNPPEIDSKVPTIALASEAASLLIGIVS